MCARIRRETQHPAAVRPEPCVSLIGIAERATIPELLDSENGATLLLMERRGVGGRARQRSRRQSMWQSAAIALLFALLTHHVLMASPLRAALPAMVSASQQSNLDMPCGGSCPTGIISLCIPGRVCAAFGAALTRFPLAPVMLVVLLILALLAIRAPFVAFRQRHWLWPPERRRALLQVFLI